MDADVIFILPKTRAELCECANVVHCPHVGGAAIGMLVNRANDNE